MQRITTTTNGRHAAPARRRYWLTPRAWNKRCSHCGMIGSIAYRALGRKFACESCVERLGIRAMESKAWRDGGAPPRRSREPAPGGWDGGEMTEQIRLFDSPPVRRYPTPQSVICNDCSRLVWDELYMVHDDVWPLLPWEGLLCIGCIEERIGRRLTPADFTDAPANDPTAPRFQGSRRFLDRLGWSERSPRRA